MVSLMSRMVPDIVLWFCRFLSDSGDEAERDVFCRNVRLRNKSGDTSMRGLLRFNYRHSARHGEMGLVRCPYQVPTTALLLGVCLFASFISNLCLLLAVAQLYVVILRNGLLRQSRRQEFGYVLVT